MVDYNQFEDDEQQQPGQVQGVQQVIGGSTAVPQAVTAQGAGVGGQQSQQGSGRFTNIQKYLKANQGSQLADQLGGKIKKEGENPLANIGTATDQFSQRLSAEQNRLGDNATNLFGKVNNFATNTPLSREDYEKNPKDLRPKTPGSFSTQQFQASPYEDYLKTFGPNGTLDDNDVSAFQKIYQGQAEMPTIDNMGDLAHDASRIGELAQAAGTEAGRFGLLKQYFNKPTYSTGQQRLDQLLLQTKPGASKSLTGAANEINSQVQTGLNALKTKQETEIPLLQKLALDRKNEAMGQLGTEAIGLDKKGSGLLGGLVDTLEDRVNKSNTDTTKLRGILSDVFNKQATGGMDQAQLASDYLRSIGLRDDQAVYMPSDFNASQFIMPAPQATFANTASPEERARYLMLQKLAGNSAPTVFTGNEQLGGFDPKQMFDKTSFDAQQSELASRASATAKPYEDAVRAIQNESYDDYYRQREDSGQLAGNYNNWNSYRMQRLADAQKQLTDATSPYGRTTIADLISKYGTIPMRNF